MGDPRNYEVRNSSSVTDVLNECGVWSRCGAVSVVSRRRHSKTQTRQKERRNREMA